MSIEQKIAQILAESRAAQNIVDEEQFDEEVKLQGSEKGASDVVTSNASAAEGSHITGVSDGVTKVEGDNEANKKNNVDKQDTGGTSQKANPANSSASAPEASHIAGMKEDIDALVEGENLTEEFKVKAATIFEAAVTTRVKQEVAKLDEAYDDMLNEEIEQIKEGLVEKVNGYLDYVVEQWIEQNEIALESGMKSEILEGFVNGLKGLFEEHYIEVPEERFDVMGALEEEVSELNSKLDEQFEETIALRQALASYQKQAVITGLSEGMVDADKEKFQTLVEELTFEDEATFERKAQTIRESYFTNKATTQSVVSSIVTDEPVVLHEEKVLPASMKSYLSILDNLK